MGVRGEGYLSCNGIPRCLPGRWSRANNAAARTAAREYIIRVLPSEAESRGSLNQL